MSYSDMMLGNGSRHVTEPSILHPARQPGCHVPRGQVRLLMAGIPHRKWAGRWALCSHLSGPWTLKSLRANGLGTVSPPKHWRHGGHVILCGAPSWALWVEGQPPWLHPLDPRNRPPCDHHRCPRTLPGVPWEQGHPGGRGLLWGRTTDLGSDSCIT